MTPRPMLFPVLLGMAAALGVACGDDDSPSPDPADVTVEDTDGHDASPDGADADATIPPDGQSDADADADADVATETDTAPDSDAASDADAAPPPDGETDVEEDSLDASLDGDVTPLDDASDVDDEPELLPCGGADASIEGRPYLPAAMVGTEELVYDAIADGGPWDDGASITAVLGSSDTLTVDGVAMTDAFRRTDARAAASEAIWCAGDYEYALSDVGLASFVEINVFDRANPGDDGLSRFVGQLRPGATGPSNELIVPFVGSYPVTEIWAGNHERETLEILSDGSIDFDDGVFVPFSSATVVHDRRSCCTRVQIDYEPSEANAYTTTINLHYEIDGDVEVLKDVERRHRGEDGEGSGTEDVSVRDPIGPIEPTGDASTLPPDTISGTVDGVLVTSSEMALPAPVFGSFTLRGQNASDAETDPGLTVWTLTAPAQVGFWSCRAEEAASRAEVRWRTPGAPPSGTSGDTGDCMVWIDTIETSGNTLVSVEGRFVAALRDSHRNLVGIVEDGAFRYDAER